MKILRSILILFCLYILPSVGLQAGKDFLGADWTTYSGFKVDTQLVRPEKEVHPSLWFSKTELLKLKETFDADETIASYWERVKNHPYLTCKFPEVISDDQLWIPELAKKNNKRIHQYYGDMTQIPAYSAFMVWMTDDADQKAYYLNRAKKALFRVFDGPIYDLDPRLNGVDKSVDEIYQGVWVQSVCTAYDLIQPFLTEEEDATIRARLLKHARYMHQHLDSWALGPHNHLSKPAWGLATYALTFSSESDAADWFKNAMEAANQNTRYYFSEDGIYREGGMYYIFSWLNYLPFLYQYKNVSGVDYFVDFAKTFEWGVLSRNAKGWLMNVEDSFLKPLPAQWAAKGFADYRSFINPSVPFSEVLQWSFKHTDFKPFDDIVKAGGYNFTGSSWDYPLELYRLFTYDPSIKATAPSIDPTVFMDGGQTFFRSSWLNEPEDQYYLLFHGVPQADNHDHHDTLSFVLYAKNQMMASDSGYTRTSYGNKIRYTYYRRPEAHNTITLDGIPLGDFSENRVNPSEDRLNTSFFDFEKKSAPFRRYLGESIGEANRSIAFIQNEYFLVMDEVKCYKIGNYEYLGPIDLYFHGGRASLERDGNHCLWSYEDDPYGNSSKLLTVQLAPEAETTVIQAENTYIKKDFKTFPTLRLTAVDYDTLFAQILYPLDEDEEQPSIEDISSPELLGAVIKTVDHKDLFLKSHERVGGSRAGLEFDGDFVWLRQEKGQVTKWSAQSVQRVAFNDQVLIQASEPLTLAFDMSESMEIGVRLERPTELKLHVGDKAIGEVLFEGQRIPFTRDGDVLIIKLTQSGNYFLL